MFDTEMLSSGLDLLDAEWDDDHGLPADLETIPPGLLLAVILASVDRDRLSGFDRVSLLKARARLRSWIDAELYADIQAVSVSVTEELDDLWEGETPDPEIVEDATAAEIQTALCLTRRAAGIQTDMALQLCQRLPGVWEALHSGLIDMARARILSDLTMPLPRELARQVCDAALDRAPQLTTGQLRAHLARLIITIDPTAAQRTV